MLYYPSHTHSVVQMMCEFHLKDIPPGGQNVATTINCQAIGPDGGLLSTAQNHSLAQPHYVLAPGGVGVVVHHMTMLVSKTVNGTLAGWHFNYKVSGGTPTYIRATVVFTAQNNLINTYSGIVDLS